MKHTHMDRPQDREAALCELALEKTRDERAAFLDAVCAGNLALRVRLEELLAAHEQRDTERAGLTTAQRARLNIDSAEAPDEGLGQRIDRYKLLQRIGEGGCGAVYMGRAGGTSSSPGCASGHQAGHHPRSAKYMGREKADSYQSQ